MPPALRELQQRFAAERLYNKRSIVRMAHNNQKVYDSEKAHYGEEAYGEEVDAQLTYLYQ